MKTGKLKKILASVLTITMAFTLIAFNSHINAEDKDNGLKLDKTAKLNEDGTATITLEAYATGTVTQGNYKPLDIVMVLDQSGSMIDNGKLTKLQTAVKGFLGNIQKDAQEKNVDHRVAMLGFASNENDGKSSSSDCIISENSSNKNWINTGLFINGYLKNYQTPSYKEVYFAKSSYLNNHDCYVKINGDYKKLNYNRNSGYYYRNGYWNEYIEIKNSANDNGYQVYEYSLTDLTPEDYKSSLVSVNQGGNLNPSLVAASNRIGASGATRASYGMKMANKVFENNSSDRQKVVVFFSDGQPGKSGYEELEANSAIAQSYITKNTYNAKVYTIGLYNKSGNENTVNFMEYMSSNYPNADSMEIPGDKDSKANYYKETSNPNDLNDIFVQISEDISTSNTELDQNAVISDFITHSFKTPIDKNNIKVYTQNYLGNERWDKKEEFTAAKVSINENKIDVSGFDYKNNYVLEKDPETEKATGKKIVIDIIVTPIDGFIGGNEVFTNEKAVIKENETTQDIVDTFPQPTVDIPLQYDFDNYDATIYIGDNWEELQEFIDDSTKDGIQYKINGNEYTIDGINNEYANIEYVIKDGDVIVGNYKVNGGEKTWSDIKTQIDSTKLTDCHNYTINVKVTPKIEKEKGVADLEVNKEYSTLHILKPSINLTDETIFLGDNTDLTNRVSVNDKWNCNHPERPEPSTKTPTLNYTFDPEQKDQGTLNGSVYTPNIKKDTDFSLSVYNGKTNITQYTKFHNDTRNIDENTFKIKVVAGKIILSKKLMNINDIDLSDGDPIFAFEIKATDGLYEGQTFYRYVRMTTDGKLVDGKVMPAIEDLPKGTYEITELSTLRYSFVNSQVNTSSSTTNRTVQVTINGVESAEQKVSYTNKVKSKDYDSDNDVLINKFVKDKDGKVTIVQEKLSK